MAHSFHNKSPLSLGNLKALRVASVSSKAEYALIACNTLRAADRNKLENI
jgi:hypothetical protein